MDRASDLRDAILPAWRTNALVTQGLVQRLPRRVYLSAIPGSPRRTVRMLAAHLHNSRCMWLRTLGKPLGLKVPAPVDRRTVSRVDLVRALRQSAEGMASLLALGCDRGGHIPPTRQYVWRNLALDVGHVLTYFVAHEAHHRGQLALIAQQLGAPLPPMARSGLWQWKPPAARRRTPRAP
jgi:uncharacterized damage-inducible protein DinB